MAAELACRQLAPLAWPTFAPTWDALHRAGERTSFFVSAPWVGAWLSVFGEPLRPRLVAFYDGSTAVGACLLVPRYSRRGFVPVRQLHFQTAGEDAEEAVFPEYVAPVARAGSEEAVIAALVSYLREEPWDEFVAGGLTESAYTSLAQCGDDWRSWVEWSESPYVDLAALRARGAEYESLLSRNTREQLRQSLRAYRQLGELRLDVADSVEAAERAFGDLGVLHEAAWRSRGKKGAFASPRRRAFHTALIRSAFPLGQVLLARVITGEETVAVVYGFADRGRFLFYQSGLRFMKGNRFRPGMVTHRLMIEHCLARGDDEYDFLAGDPEVPRYKASLATASRRLAWAVFERRNPRMRLVNALRGAKSLLWPRR